MKTAFSANQFVATQWEPAEEKAKFANQFLNFVESGFSESKFPKWFYKRLSMIFGHIAHYDQSGFFAEFFTTTKDKLRFLRQCANASCFGDPTYVYSDVERALQDWMRRVSAVSMYEKMLLNETERGERAELARLKGKYEGAKPCP